MHNGAHGKPMERIVNRAKETRELGAGVYMSWEMAEARLREWDMNSRFGPGLSMTRKERWARAEKLDLDPPVLVYNIIKAFPELNDKFIWKGRIQPEEHIIGV